MCMCAQVCYYSRHYVAFVKRRPGNQWELYDDSSIIPVGAWPAVCKRCEAGRIQPNLLFFEAAERASAV